MTPREELDALRRMAELEAKAGNSGQPNGGLSEADRATLLAAKPLDRGGRNDYGALGAARDVVAGGVRGAGSIGATMIGPIDWAMDKMEGRGGHTLSSLITGVKPLTRNEQRRANMDAALSSLLGADTDSISYQVGKIGAEVAGTAGVGGVLANGVRGAAAASPLAARFIPAALPDALATAGMNAGSGNALSRIGLRTLAGASTGAVSAGLIDPDAAATGGVVGAVLPNALAGLARAGRAAGRAIRGPEQSPELAARVAAARDAGYVIPPTQANPSLGNRVLEGFSGKITTAQNASAKNQAVTNRLASEALGLPGNTPITVDALNAVRANAGKAYEALAVLPPRPAIQGSSVLNQKPIEGFNPRQALQDLRQARNDATAWFAAYGRSASPDDQAKAKAAAALASNIERKFEEYAASIGREDLVPAMQEARKLIAKTYSVEKALNPTTGSVDARKLAAQLAKGKPLSGELRGAAEFAAQFPKAAQAVEGMGSLPQTSPLDWGLAGGLSAATANPLAMAAVMARPAARSLTLSPSVQNRLIQGSPNSLQILSNPELLQSISRAGPVIAAQ